MFFSVPPQSSGQMGVALSQTPPSHQQSTPNSALATTGGTPSLPGRAPVPPQGGINSTVSQLFCVPLLVYKCYFYSSNFLIIWG